MFRQLINSYRAKADEQLADADELESGRWRWGNQDGDQSGELAALEERSGRQIARPCQRI